MLNMAANGNISKKSSNNDNKDKIPKRMLKKVLNADEYNKIAEFIKKYNGLTIDCEYELILMFKDIHPETIKYVIQNEWSFHMRTQLRYYDYKAELILETFIKRLNAAAIDDTTILLKMAKEKRLSPTALCRIILQQQYFKLMKNKQTITTYLRNPQMIPNQLISENVIHCLSNDVHDGPLIDLKRRILGDEYECKLKQMAIAAGLHFQDENELRRLGYDKTPDIKLVVPFLYKMKIINWIESKATFGDIKTHKIYMSSQLTSYTNRFGPGIVIYWFGHHADIENVDAAITVLHTFPDQKDITTINVGDNDVVDDNDDAGLGIDVEHKRGLIQK